MKKQLDSMSRIPEMISNQLATYFALIVFLAFYGCQHKTNAQVLNKTNKPVPIQFSDLTNRPKGSNEKVAVIYKSTDLGASWSSFDNGIPSEATLSCIKQAGDKIYVTTDYHGIYVSSKGENKWISLPSGKLSGLDINCIEVDDSKIIVGTLNKGIFVSNDGGVNWDPARKNISTSAIRAFIKKEEILYAGTDSGIYESINLGETWEHVFGSLQILGFTELNGKIYAATQNGVITNDGTSTDWTEIYNGDALHDIGNDGTYIYAMTIGQQLLKTKDDGVTWESAQHGIVQPENFYTNEVQHFQNDVFSAQWIGIYHSSDNGNNWSILEGLPDSTAFSTLEITDFGIIAGISIR